MKNPIKTLARWLEGLSPSCKEATRLQSAALDRRLTAVEWLVCAFTCSYASGAAVMAGRSILSA